MEYMFETDLIQSAHATVENHQTYRCLTNQQQTSPSYIKGGKLQLIVFSTLKGGGGSKFIAFIYYQQLKWNLNSFRI